MTVHASPQGTQALLAKASYSAEVAIDDGDDKALLLL